MIKKECFKISNQRRSFYIACDDVSEHDLFDLWIKLSRIGYYKIFDKVVIIDVSNIPCDTYFESLDSFSKKFGF